jgi:hypothetical protein
MGLTKNKACQMVRREDAALFWVRACLTDEVRFEGHKK